MDKDVVVKMSDSVLAELSAVSEVTPSGIRMFDFKNIDLNLGPVLGTFNGGMRREDLCLMTASAPKHKTDFAKTLSEQITSAQYPLLTGLLKEVDLELFNHLESKDNCKVLVVTGNSRNRGLTTNTEYTVEPFSVLEALPKVKTKTIPEA